MEQNKKPLVVVIIELIGYSIALFFAIKAFLPSSGFSKSSVQPKINMPTLPQTFTNESYSSVSKIVVNDISYTYEIHDTMWVTFTASVTLNSKVGQENVSDNLEFGYKVYDSKNTVVSSGTVYTPAVSVGETTTDDFTVYDLDPNETYTLKILQST